MDEAQDYYAGFPLDFFRRSDDADDGDFYLPARLVTHIDNAAIVAVGALYAELGIDGSAPATVRVLDVMSSWVSHFQTAPAELTLLGMNTAELEENSAATSFVVRDLNADPTLPFPDSRFDAVTCCVSIDYLIHPIEVLAEVSRVLTPGGAAVITFSNRCFPTKAVRGWLSTDDDMHCAIVAEFFRRAGGFTEPAAQLRTRPGFGDPLYAVIAYTVTAEG